MYMQVLDPVRMSVRLYLRDMLHLTRATFSFLYLLPPAAKWAVESPNMNLFDHWGEVKHTEGSFQFIRGEGWSLRSVLLSVLKKYFTKMRNYMRFGERRMNKMCMFVKVANKRSSILCKMCSKDCIQCHLDGSICSFRIWKYTFLSVADGKAHHVHSCPQLEQ